jgi:hypothetical protein
VQNIGTGGATTNFYEISALDGNGNETLVGTPVSTTTANATLDGTNYNKLTWLPRAYAASYNVYGRTSGVRTLLGNTATTQYLDQGASIGTAKPTQNSTGGYVWVDLIPTVGATPAGLSYVAVYDPTPSDTTRPVSTKDGYWSNYWASRT